MTGHEERVVRAGEAKAAAKAMLVGPPLRRRDLAMAFEPSIATSVEPLLHGRRYFPRMIEDIEGARDHVHLLIYGFKPGTIGDRFRDLLLRKVREGVRVRLEVDALGSEVAFGSRDLFAGLRAGGVETTANHGLPLDRLSRTAVAGRGFRRADLLHFDHRKMAVIDGRIGWVGGSGIEDHYADERFYDVMCRVTGPVVSQLQMVFLASWRYHGGTAPDAPSLDECFPPDLPGPPGDVPLRVPTTVLWNVPGTGHQPISDAIVRSIEEATDRIDIVNPYVSNRAILDRLHAAARRGVRVRIVAPGRPTPPYPAAAFRHHHQRLRDAGVEILLHPEMAHAKVLRLDDRVVLGGCNLDDLSLFRNDELDLLFEGHEVAQLVEREVFDELVRMSRPAIAARSRRGRAWDAAMDRLSPLL
jgi:cardiolipin synthase